MAAAEKYKNEGARWFMQLNHILNTSVIDEFDIVPSIDEDFTSSDPFILYESKLGLYSWCVKQLFCFAYKELMQLKKQEFIAELKRVLDLSRVVLLINAENYTIWNIRKQCIGVDEKLVEAELIFTTLVLSKHPRSAESFSHRRWVLKFLRTNFPEKFSATNELNVCLGCALRYRDNYIAWDHRSWFIKECMKNDNEKETLLSELQITEDFLWKHISDNCVFHYRRSLLQQLQTLCTRDEIGKLLDKEVGITIEILGRYHGHETVWYHRRFLIEMWSRVEPPCTNCLAYVANKYQHITTSPNSSTQPCYYCVTSENSIDLPVKREHIFCSLHSDQELVDVMIPEVKRQLRLAIRQLLWLHLYLKQKLKCR